jgi:putative hydrolase of the HAD superfamily
MKAVLFDLDDTLYPEIEFVKSGFTSVARHLASKHNLDEDSIFQQMLDILRRDGRGKIFDTLLEKLGMFSGETVGTLVDLYRSHQPSISLYPDTLPALGNLRRNGIKIGLITDAMASVQKNKVEALGLENLFDIIVYTEELGEGCSKPSPVPFKTALDFLKVPASEAAYVGDDPSKDFLAPNNLGMLTVQVARQTPPDFKPVPPPAGAQYVVKNLAGIFPIINKSLP